MFSIVRLIFVTTCVWYQANAINVLGVFDIPSKSVHILGHELMLGLARRGYNVTLISSFPLTTQQANYTHIYLDGLLEYKESK